MRLLHDAATGCALDPGESVAFLPDIAEEWNVRAAEVDRRLFCFAYYEPKEWVGQDAEAGFLRAVANLYGLLKDCGNLPGALLNASLSYDYASRRSILSSEDLDKIRTFFDNVCDLRTYLFHNASPALGQGNKRAQDVFFQYVRRAMDDRAWERGTVRLLQEAAHFSGVIERFLSGAKALQGPAREKLIKNWIGKAILYQYKNNRDLFYKFLTATYIRWHQNKGDQEPNVILAQNLVDWCKKYIVSLDFSLCSKEFSIDSCRQYFASKMMDDLAAKFDRPMLPAEFYGELFNGLAHFF